MSKKQTYNQQQKPRQEFIFQKKKLPVYVWLDWPFFFF